MADDRVVLRIEVDDTTKGEGGYQRVDPKQVVSDAKREARATPTAGSSASRSPSGSAGASAASSAASAAASRAGSSAGAAAAGGAGGGSAGSAAAAGAGGSAVAAGAAAGAVALAALVAAAYALRKSFDALNDEVERAERYNANVAGAVAVGEVREQLGDIRRAQQLGPMLTDFVLQRDELAEELRDLRANILQVVGPLVTSGLESLTAILEAINSLGELFDEKTIEGLRSLLEGLGIDKKSVDAIVAAARKFQQDSDDVDGDFLKDIETFLDPVRVDKGLRTLARKVGG